MRSGDFLQCGDFPRDGLEIAVFHVGDGKNTSRMTEKLKLICEFNYPDQKDKEGARNAVAAVEKLMCGSFKITQISAEGLKKKRNTYVRIATGVSETKDLKQYKKDGEGVPVETTIKDSKCPQWNDDDELLSTKLPWKPGQPIRLEWRRVSTWRDECIASISSMTDWLGFLEILQPHVEMRHDSYGNLDNPTITSTCDEFPNPEEDLRWMKRYVIPGTYWTDPEQ